MSTQNIEPFVVPALRTSNPVCFGIEYDSFINYNGRWKQKELCSINIDNQIVKEKMIQYSGGKWPFVSSLIGFGSNLTK